MDKIRTMDKIIEDIYKKAKKNKGIRMDAVYKAMSRSDLLDAVFAAKDIMDKIEFFKHLPRDGSMKSECLSNQIREEGNKAYLTEQHQLALEFYNQALALAPQNSRAMKLIYSNRSALLMKTSNYIGALKDIEQCFRMGCPDDIKEKLKKREHEIRKKTWIERLTADASESLFNTEFFKVRDKVHPDIPCATDSIAVIEECGKQKIVTSKNIRVGTVLASETAFVSHLSLTNKYLACYYCTKLSMNLMPCPGCCHALFCSEQCKQQSVDDGHNIECQFMDIFSHFNVPLIHTAFKSALKMRQMAESWEEFINASCSTGDDRLRNSTIQEIYDANKNFSLLTAKNDTIFMYGKLYRCSFACAGIMHYLRDVSSYLPVGQEEKLNAIRGLLRVTIHLYLHGPPLLVTPCAISMKQQVTQFHSPHYGSFSFAGKLKHSCHSNCLSVSIENKLIIFAISPMTPGTELTISKYGQFMNHRDILENKQMLNAIMIKMYGFVCDCVCTNDKLSPAQEKLVANMDIKKWCEVAVSDDISGLYPKLCKALTDLSDVPHTTEYRSVFQLFISCVLRAQIIASRNVLIDYKHFAAPKSG